MDILGKFEDIRIPMKKLIIFGTVIFPLTVSFNAMAWGRRGHQIVAETAARLVSDEPQASFMSDHSFDFGYYANVPDFIWKRPKTYEIERNQHFMDFELYQEAFKKQPEVRNPFALTRQEFEKQFPEVPENAGRAFWRIREMNDQLSDLTRQLQELKESSGKARQALQEKWIVIAGTMGHYVGDLAQPLHVTENYDGEKTDQKGIHSYFEDEMVDQLYPDINCQVQKAAQKAWLGFKKKNANRSVVELLEALSLDSRSKISDLLATDKKHKRKNPKTVARKYEALIKYRLVQGALTLAEIYRRQLGWSFDNHRFYFFAGEPEYNYPPLSKKSADK